MFDPKQDGDLLVALKKEFAKKPDCFTDADLARLYDIAVNNKFSAGLRTLSAQLFVRAGGNIVFTKCRNEELLCGAIIECKPELMNEMLQWFIGLQERVGVPVLHAVLSRLHKNVKKTVANISPVVALNALKSIFRGFIVQCSSADEIRSLESVLDLQRHYGMKAWEQFELLSAFPDSMKLKFTLLSVVIPALNSLEFCSAENTLVNSLWRCSSIQYLASSTGDCVLAWGLTAVKFCSNGFCLFLSDALMSNNSVRRTSSAGFWLARLGTSTVLRPLLNVVVALFEKRLSQYPEGSSSGEEIRQLSCIDYDWNWKEDEEYWAPADRVLYGWVSIQEVLTKSNTAKLNDNEYLILKICLNCCQTAVRLRAFRIAKRLIKINAASLIDLADFIFDNIGTDDVSLREAVVEYACEKMVQFGGSFLQKLVLRMQAGWNAQTILSSLSIYLKCGNIHDLTDETVLRLSHLATCANSQLRHAASFLLPDILDEHYIKQFKEQLEVALLDVSEDMDRINDLVHLLLNYSCEDWVFQKARQIFYASSPGCLKYLYVLFQKRSNFFTAEDVKLCLSNNWVLIEKVLVESGSHSIGECTALAHLANHLSPELTIDSVMLNTSRRSALNVYYWKLRCAAEIVTLLCKEYEVSISEIDRTFEVLWNILLRSYHKGVVDHVADCLEQLAVYCLKERSLNFIPEKFYHETKRIFSENSSTTRNLAFSRILRFLALQINKVTSLVQFLLSCTSGIQSEKLAIRAWKTLKYVLTSAEIDVSSQYLSIFTSLLDAYVSSSWAVRSAVLHCFAVLISRISQTRESSKCPLYSFIIYYKDIWNEMLRRFRSLSAEKKETILLLSLLENFHLIGATFYTQKQLSEVQLLVSCCVKLLYSTRSVRDGRLIGRCLLQLSLDYSLMKDKLKLCLTRKISKNLSISIEYILNKIGSESSLVKPIKFDGRPEDIMKKGNGKDILIAERLITRLNSCFCTADDMEYFERLFCTIEKASLSGKELKRLCAAHFCTKISRTLLQKFHHLYARYFCCVCSLLMDEISSIRNIATRVAFECIPALAFLSSSSAQTIKILIDALTRDGTLTRLQLAAEWQEWSQKTYHQRLMFNRYFEDQLILESLKE